MAPGQPASGSVRDRTPRDIKKSSGETAPGHRSHELSPLATALESHLGVEVPCLQVRSLSWWHQDFLLEPVGL